MKTTGIDYEENKREEKKKYLKERREWLHAHHLCVDCKQMDAFTMVGKYRCAECSEKARVKKTGNVIPKTFRSEMGLCVNCGKEPIQGMKVCENCRKHMIEMSKASHRDHGKGRNTDFEANPKIPRREWIANGFCYLCGEKAYKNFKVCEKCRNRLREQRKRQGENGLIKPMQWFGAWSKYKRPSKKEERVDLP